MARRVAALAACKRLYEVGALTDHLLPAAEDEDLDKVGNDNTNRRNLPTGALRIPVDDGLQLRLGPYVEDLCSN